MADLSITVNGMKFDNPFLLGSGPPPGTNGKVIAALLRSRLGRDGVQDVLARRQQGESTPRRATRSTAVARATR